MSPRLSKRLWFYAEKCYEMTLSQRFCVKIFQVAIRVIKSKKAPYIFKVSHTLSLKEKSILYLPYDQRIFSICCSKPK